jgi:LacI family transcriptional regulator
MRRPRVALFVETSREYGRRVLAGVTHYLSEHGPWSVYFRPQGLADPPPRWLGGWDGDGILVRTDNPEFGRLVAASGVPAIDLRLGTLGPELPAVGVDNFAVAEIGARHLLDQGFRRFAFCGLHPGENLWADVRRARFAAVVTAAGHACDHFPVPGRPPVHSWDDEQVELGRWLAGLTKPVGVMACYDDRGHQVLDACRAAGVRVPDEVAVVGVDNDAFLCGLSHPPLTSIDVGAERVGYEAAALLARMMAGARRPGRPLMLPPLGLVARQSSDVLAVDDPELVALIRYIRAHACEGARVADAVAASGESYSSLKKRFKALLGRTPKQEIVRVQVERARALLATTDLPVADVASRCGFASPKRLFEVFAARGGVTPGEYRRQSRRPF